MQLTKYSSKGRKPLWRLEVGGYSVILTARQLAHHGEFNKAVLRQTLIDEDTPEHSRAFAPLKKDMTKGRWEMLVDQLMMDAVKVQGTISIPRTPRSRRHGVSRVSRVSPR